MPLNVTLASSLLDLEADQHRIALEAGGRTFRTGIEALDRDLPSSLWRGGDVVGIGSDLSGGLGNKADSLPLEIIVTHLLDGRTIDLGESTSNPNSDNVKPSVFIVAPPTQATASIQQIYTKLNTTLLHDQQQPKQRTPPPKTTRPTHANPKQPSTTATTINAQAKSLLTRLSLLQYLDISGLAESISEILTVLTQSQSPSSPSPSPSPQRTILLLQSLPQTLTTTHRRTGTLQTAALLTSLLQSLRNIARISGGTCLVLVELDVSWSGGASSNTVPATTNAALGLPGLRTAFSSRTGKTLRVASGPVFGRILQEGVDVLVVLHDGEGRVGKGGAQGQRRSQRVVECVRDERVLSYGEGEEGGEGMEDAFGAWSVWG